MNALTELKRMETPTTTDATESQVMSALEQVPQAHVIDLPNGIQVFRKSVPGREYFEFLKVSKDGHTEDGIRYLIMQMFEVVGSGKALTIEQIEDEDGIGFEGVAMLADEIVKVFPQARAKLTSSQQPKLAARA